LPYEGNKYDNFYKRITSFSARLNLTFNGSQAVFNDIQCLHRRVKFDGLKTPKVEEKEPHALEMDQEEAPPP